MVIYEVNLTINNEIFEPYYQWLTKHIEIMLTFNGFNHAEISEEVAEDLNGADKTKMTVRYYIETHADLEDYLKNYSPKMRADGMEKFGTKFSAFRRNFKDPLIFNRRLVSAKHSTLNHTTFLTDD